MPDEAQHWWSRWTEGPAFALVSADIWSTILLQNIPTQIKKRGADICASAHTSRVPGWTQTNVCTLEIQRERLCPSHRASNIKLSFREFQVVLLMSDSWPESTVVKLLWEICIFTGIQSTSLTTQTWVTCTEWDPSNQDSSKGRWRTAKLFVFYFTVPFPRDQWANTCTVRLRCWRSLNKHKRFVSRNVDSSSVCCQTAPRSTSPSLSFTGASVKCAVHNKRSGWCCSTNHFSQIMVKLWVVSAPKVETSQQAERICSSDPLMFGNTQSLSGEVYNCSVHAHLWDDARRWVKAFPMSPIMTKTLWFALTGCCVWDARAGFHDSKHTNLYSYVRLAKRSDAKCLTSAASDFCSGFPSAWMTVGAPPWLGSPAQMRRRSHGSRAAVKRSWSKSLTKRTIWLDVIVLWLQLMHEVHARTSR